MKIDIRNIPPSGCILEDALDKDHFNLRPQEIECLFPVKLSITIEKASAMVHAKVLTQTIFRYICGRCLESREQNFNEQFDFYYPIETHENYIDLGEDVRQEILLGFPSRVVCQEQCKGLCAGCGANLNEEQCRCQK